MLHRTKSYSGIRVCLTCRTRQLVYDEPVSSILLQVGLSPPADAGGFFLRRDGAVHIDTTPVYLHHACTKSMPNGSV
jgi:hypothetical protein